MNTLYLLLDLGAISLPLAFSFYPKANFSKKWKYAWLAILIPAFLFIVWDIQFTQMGVWGFNPRYITGISLFSLPLEEMLFFVCIPYACLFTYEALGYLLIGKFSPTAGNYIVFLLLFFLLTLGILNLGRWYTATTFLGLSCLLLIARIRLPGEKITQFFLSYALILLPFFLINGILTGSWIEEEVVWYNNEENLGLRLGTIPLEDIFYGMLLILMNVSLFERLQRRPIEKPTL